MRRTFFVLPLTMIGLVIVLVGQLASHGFGPPRSESEIALAFSCGFRGGQVSITSRLPVLFKEPEASENPKDYCIPFYEMAERHGFHSAADR